MQNTLFIPSKIKIGFQKRSDTFTGKLAYVIYYDEKGKLRKETSWENWRDKKIEAIEYENTPRNNYVLNKGINRFNDWGGGRSVVRIHDPRDFEFEIGLDNLIGILMHSDVSKRDIVEECVFAWNGPDLVLLPVNSEEYQSSVKYTERQSDKLSAKDLKVGLTYGKKKNLDEELVYIGFYPFYENSYGYYSSNFSGNKLLGKKHIFRDVKGQYVIPSVGTLTTAITDEPSEHIANYIDKFFKSIHAGSIKNIFVKPAKAKSNSTSYYNSISTIYDVLNDTSYIKVETHHNDYSGNKVIPLDSLRATYFELRQRADGKGVESVNVKDERVSAYVTKTHGTNRGYGYYGYNRIDYDTVQFNAEVIAWKQKLSTQLNTLYPAGATPNVGYTAEQYIHAFELMGLGKLCAINEHNKTIILGDV